MKKSTLVGHLLEERRKNLRQLREDIDNIVYGTVTEIHSGRASKSISLVDPILLNKVLLLKQEIRSLERIGPRLRVEEDGRPF